MTNNADVYTGPTAKDLGIVYFFKIPFSAMLFWIGLVSVMLSVAYLIIVGKVTPQPVVQIVLGAGFLYLSWSFGKSLHTTLETHRGFDKLSSCIDNQIAEARRVRDEAFEAQNNARELYAQCKKPMREDRTDQWVVCAANRMTFKDEAGQIRQITIAGARHCDSVMNPLRHYLTGDKFSDHSWANLPAEEKVGSKHDITELRGKELAGQDNLISEEQGFIDQKGNFLTREEAWDIAEVNGQIFREVGGNHYTDESGKQCHRLFSENLY